MTKEEKMVLQARYGELKKIYKDLKREIKSTPLDSEARYQIGLEIVGIREELKYLGCSLEDSAVRTNYIDFIFGKMFLGEKIARR